MSTAPAPSSGSPGLSSTTSEYLREASTFDWSGFRVAMPTRAVLAIAISLGVGIALGSPGGGLVAAAGAFQAGFGALQRIRGSCLLPMLLASVGTAVSTGIGMVLGHQSITFVVLSGLWAAAYALLTAKQGGTSWVGLQCVIVLVVGSAFHVHPGAALTRCGLMLAGGLLQTLIAVAFVYLPHRWGADTDCIATSRPDPATLPDPGLLRSLGNLRECLLLKNPVCVYAARLGLTVAAASEIYRHTGVLSGYWIPMTALLVLKPDFHQTLVRGLMRVGGTLVGAGLAGLIAAQVHPSVVTLAILVVFFAWLGYAVFGVNYALYTLNLTAYIVFLLSLAGIPPATVVHRRALFTLLGGVLALLAYLDVLRRSHLAIKAARLERELQQNV